MFDAEVARRLKHNGDFEEFVKALEVDVEVIKEQIATLERDTMEPIIRLQERIKTIRLIIAKPDVTIEQESDATESE